MIARNVLAPVDAIRFQRPSDGLVMQTRFGGNRARLPVLGEVQMADPGDLLGGDRRSPTVRKRVDEVDGHRLSPAAATRPPFAVGDRACDTRVPHERRLVRGR